MGQLHMGWGEFLKGARERAHFTQRELAKKAGVSQPTISAIERGEGEPSRHQGMAIEGALGCVVDPATPYAPSALLEFLNSDTGRCRADELGELLRIATRPGWEHATQTEWVLLLQAVRGALRLRRLHEVDSEE